MIMIVRRRYIRSKHVRGTFIDFLLGRAPDYERLVGMGVRYVDQCYPPPYPCNIPGMASAKDLEFQVPFDETGLDPCLLQIKLIENRQVPANP